MAYTIDDALNWKKCEIIFNLMLNTIKLEIANI